VKVKHAQILDNDEWNIDLAEVGVRPGDIQFVSRDLPSNIQFTQNLRTSQIGVFFEKEL
jgi:hypothetical protein